MIYFKVSDVNWNRLIKCDSFRFRLYIFLLLIACFHFLLSNKMMMKNYKCCVFIFLFQFHFSWLLILMWSHSSMKMLHFIYLCLIVCLYKNILLFFFLNCMLNEIYFCLNYKTWKRWNFVMIFELSKYRTFVFFHFRETKSLFLFCCCWCYTVILID